MSTNQGGVSESGDGEEYFYLDCKFSDGKPLYPSNLEKQPRNDGSYEYYAPIAERSSKDVLWRTKCANHVHQLWSPEENLEAPDRYIFKKLPDNYKLFEHVKCSAKDGVLGKERSDTYLYGHPSGKRYRSPAEFFPHIAHLCTFSSQYNPDDDGKHCMCVLCTGSGVKNGPPSGSASKGSVKLREREIKRVKMVVASEERIAEQDLGGWVLRKGEIIWVWLPNNPEGSAAGGNHKGFVDGKDGVWAAGIVIDRPGFTVELYPSEPNPKTGGPESSEAGAVKSFDDLEKDNVPPWADRRGSTYTIQLCANKGENGQVIENVQQWFVRPWLARVECALDYIADRPEHPSIPPARWSAGHFSLFDSIPESTKIVMGKDSEEFKVTSYNGIYLGAEKIWAGEPIRIKCIGEAGPIDGAEDIMIVKSIRTYTSDSKIKSGKTSTKIVFKGPVYTAFPRTGAVVIEPEEFCQISHRMRRSAGGTDCINWYIPGETSGKTQVVVKSVLGRYYEPQAIQEWSNRYDLVYGGNETLKLFSVELKEWSNTRLEAYGCTTLNGRDLSFLDIIDKTPSRVGPVKLYKPEADNNSESDVMEVDYVPRGFVSVNVRPNPNEGSHETHQG